jgi:hypothetical protein
MKEVYVRPRSNIAIFEQNNHVHEQPKKKQSRFSKKGVAVGLVLASIIPALGQDIAGEPEFFPRLAFEFLADQDCVNLDENISIKIAEKLNSPDDPELVRLYTDLMRFSHIQDPIEINQTYEALAGFQKKQAEKYGITLVDPHPFLQRLDASKDTQELLEVTNDFTNEYGINFEIRPPYLLKDNTIFFERLTQEDLRYGNFKSFVSVFVKSMSQNIPLEVAHLAKNRTIIPVKNISIIDLSNPLSPRPDYEGAANSGTGITYLDYDITNPKDMGETLRHEIGHHIDGTICGDIGSLRDSEYIGFNPPGFSYGKTKDESHKVVTSSYGGTKPKEDKAEMYEVLLGGMIGFDEHSPVIRSKYEILLARLESNIPGIADYIRSISLSHRPQI